MKRLPIRIAAAAALTQTLAVTPAAGRPISLQDSFRIGTGTGILCSAQIASADKALNDMFDRAYAITCRDASVPVGRLYVLKARRADPAERLGAIRAEKATCAAPASRAIEGLAGAQAASCSMTDMAVGYRVYSLRKGDTLYVAEGLAGYDSALRLGLRTVVTDKPVEGEVSIALTEAGDAVSFARVQAGTLDPQRARAEAYRRNNSGNYAEAAEFFGYFLTSSSEGQSAQAEALANEALQESNLGNYIEANARFERAARLVGEDPVLTRMLRNYRAMHQLNQQRPRQAVAELNKPVARPTAAASTAVRELVIDKATAQRLSTDSSMSRQLSSAGGGLLPEDWMQILDGQAQYLRGSTFRLEKRPAEAGTALKTALDQLAAVRGGRVVSTVWMRAQILNELGALAEESGDAVEAERQHQAAVALLSANYPNSAALLNSQTRLASFYTRGGRADDALGLFKQIVEASAQSGTTSSPLLRRTLAPYFALLAERGSDPASIADMFRASQVLVRPGVAQTQAVLARELSGGSGDASRLFRQSVALTREAERARVEVSRLSALPEPAQSDAARLAVLKTQLAGLERDQVATQAKLADFPKYRVVAGGVIGLNELQKVLRGGEAYYKMMVVGDGVYAMLITPTTAKAYRVAATAAELEKQVEALRDTVSKIEDGQVLTLPFDVARSHSLYEQLFQPVAAELSAASHLIVEPDGALLRLPFNLLVADEASVDDYRARAARPGDDGFDFTHVKWLGRERNITTAVSARSFRDVRQVPRSNATAEYIGFGENAVPAGRIQTTSAVRGFGDQTDQCSWSMAAWSRPISSGELYTARQKLGTGGKAEIVTGADFTDTSIKQRQDLSQFRILHFATHGLVTAPRPECPARPALLTSFGGEESDGLLTFAEIFDLKIDADLVILSACDTAGKANLAATREAGVTTGGDFALDGLVRAFVGAGGRSVVASHWQLPDDYDATERLIAGMFQSPPGTATAEALRSAQLGLMNQRDTSHPFYWSGFAIIGDGAAPVVAKERQAARASGAAKLEQPGQS